MRLGTRIMIRLIVANMIAGIFVTSYFMLSTDFPDDISWERLVLATTASYFVLSGLLSGWAVLRARRVFFYDWAWYDEGTEPSDEQVRNMVQLPWRIGIYPLKYWVVVAIGNSVAAVFQTGSIVDVVFRFFVTIEGGFIASAAGYLLALRLLRPAIAVALGGRPPPNIKTLGVAPRLLLAWGLGSAIPLFRILVHPFIVDGADVPENVSMVFLAAVGLLAGLVLTVEAARSIASPVRAVRLGLGQVATGNLDVALPVNDPGELGSLQGGFNEMVGGLREREQLEDLFGRHVGPEVARRALQEGVDLGGEVRNITAFFVDLSASTTLARQRPAVEVVDLLNRFFAEVVEITDREAGLVNKFEGDAALVVFGVPTHQHAHPTHALRSARALRDRIIELRATDPAFDAGIGVSTGDAVAGNVGAHARLEYTVIGEPVNEAARLTEAAKARPSRVLAAASTIDAADEDEARCWVEAGTVDLRGLAPGLVVYEPR